MAVRIGGDVTHPITNPTDIDISVVTREQAQAPPPLPATESAPDTEKAPSPDAGSIQGFDRANVQQKLNQALIEELVRKAGVAGLDEADTERLGTILAKLPPADFKRETELFEDALHSGDRDRAMRAFLEVEPQRLAHPDRITPGIERDLVMGVGNSRIENLKGDLKGMAGVLGVDDARRAAAALINMPEGEYKEISNVLAQAGQGGGPKGSADTERALILKAVAARESAFGSPDWAEMARTKPGWHMPPTWEVIHFAEAIRGKDRSELIEKSTVQDLTSPQGTHALQQRFSTSCVPTSAQITQAESDPVTALRMHSEGIHSTTSKGDIADMQQLILKLDGGIAVPREASEIQDHSTQPRGLSPDNFAKALNQIASQATDRTYTAQGVGDSKDARIAALDKMEKLLQDHVEVPIAVYWNGGGAHALVATDVRGEKPDRTFWITDPWHGKTGWVSERDIANGNTNFFAGRGRLGLIFPGESKPAGH